MKSFNNLYQKIYSFENLHLAYMKARKNKRYKNEVLQFGNNLEENLIILQNELIYETYRPSRYREFIIKEPKVRLILALPFKDRVIHQAIGNIIEPIFEPTLINDSYACRKGKGTLAGVKKMAYYLNKDTTNSNNVFCLKMDVKKYFYSIDHAALKIFIRRKIRDKRTLKLLDIIIDSTDNPGIPVGNLTSQLFANIYLNELDHYIKEVLRIKHYVRYMDDMIILSKEKSILWMWLGAIKNFLQDELKLALNNKTSVFNVKRGIDFLGFRQFANKRILRKRVMIKNYKKFKKFSNGYGYDKISKSLASLHGLCKHCNSRMVINNINLILGDKI